MSETSPDSGKAEEATGCWVWQERGGQSLALTTLEAWKMVGSPVDCSGSGSGAGTGS